MAALCVAALGASSCENFTYPDWWPTEQAAPAEPARAPAAEPTTSGPDRSIAEVQRMLARLGYDPGPADGMLGRRSGAAIRKYRTDAGLPPGESVDADLLDRLQADIRSAERRRTITYRAAAQQPVTEAGDVYVYSDGTVETVLRRTRERVWWRTRDDREFLAYANFLLPRWQRGADGAEPPKIEADPDTLWPAPDGTPVTFQVIIPESASPSTAVASRQEWRCAVQGKRRIEVPAGQVDTLAIRCERSPAPAGQWQQRIWYYSPALAHFVRREDRMGDGTQTPPLELVAIRPGDMGWPPAARAGLDWALEQALADGPDAKPVKWASSGVEDTFVIRVLSRSSSELGSAVPCFSYMQQRLPDERYRVYAGLACRDPATGGWTVPFLGPAAPPLMPAGRS